MSVLLALDAGTGSCRAALFNEHGEQLAIAGREWTHRGVPGVPGSMGFDTEANWALIRECVLEAVAAAGNPRLDAVSSTSMREGLVVYDAAGEEIWACANVDARAADQVRSLRARGLESRFYEKSGQTFALGAAPRLLWLKERAPDIYNRADRVVMLSDWIAARLGAPLSVDPSNGGTTGLFDLETRSWSPDLLRLCGFPDSFAETPVRDSGEVIGTVSAKAASETGIPRGTPIVMGGGDAQLGSIGVGAVSPGDAAVFGGTFWQQEVAADRALIDPSGRIRLNFHAVPGVWQAETIVFFAGLAVRWARDALFPDVKRAALAAGREPYAELDAMAEAVPPGSNGVVPIFSDAMDYTHWFNAAPTFANLSLDPERCDRSVLYRSLLENTAIVVKANLESISAVSGFYPKEIVFAGGAAKGRLWPRILADVLGLKVRIPVVKEATALGAAICAGVGIGLFPSFEKAIQRIVEYDRVVEPDAASALVYAESGKRWEEVYRVQRDLAKRGVTESLWRAPGE